MRKAETARHGAYLLMQEARREVGRQLRRRREEETAWAKALDRAATAVATIVVGLRSSGLCRSSQTGEDRRDGLLQPVP